MTNNTHPPFGWVEGPDVINPEVIIAGVGIIVEVIIGSGFMKWVLGLHTKVSMLERDSKQASTDIEKLENKTNETSTQVAILKAGFGRIEARLEKLDLIDGLKSTVESMRERLDETLRQQMPRETIEAHFEKYDSSIEFIRQEKVERLRAER